MPVDRRHLPSLEAGVKDDMRQSLYTRCGSTVIHVRKCLATQARQSLHPQINQSVGMRELWQQKQCVLGENCEQIGQSLVDNAEASMYPHQIPMHSLAFM